MVSQKTRVAFLSHHDDVQSLPKLELAAFNWLSAQEGHQVELVGFSQADKLSEFDGAWWYYAESIDLPVAALDAKDQVRQYVEQGGKLLLTLVAAKYVEPLGLDRAPDAVKCDEKGFFYWNGYKVLEKHPIFEGLSKGFFVADTATLEPFANARWLQAPPDNGKLLAVAYWGARFVEDERVVVEWDCGAGQVLALGMHNFRFDGEELSTNLQKFAKNVLSYITSPFEATLTLESDNPAVGKGAGYLGSHYGDGGVVIETGEEVWAVVSGKAWKKLDVAVSAKTSAGAISTVSTFSPGQAFSIKLPLNLKKLAEGEHVAVAEVTVGDEVLASLSRKLFIVPELGVAGPADRHWLWEAKSDNIAAEIDKTSGTIWGIYSPSDEHPVQFAANPDNNPAIATAAHRWLGDMTLKYKFAGDMVWRSMTTADSASIRRVQAKNDAVVTIFDPGPPEQVGPTEPGITERFAVDETGLNWQIKIKNRSQSPFVLGEVCLPLALNTCFAGEVDLAEMYERRVILHSYIGGASSWVIAAPLAGKPPYMLFYCKDGGRLEAMAHLDEYGTKPDGWEGLINVFPYSKASRETRNWKDWYNGHNQTPILPGEELVLDFGIKLISDYKEIGDTLYETGKVAVDVAPGMVLPIDMTGHFRVRSKNKATVEGDCKTNLELVKTDGDSAVYKLKFDKAGPHTVAIRDQNGEETYLHFLATEPLEKLANAHGAHVAKDQQYRNPGGHNDGMFIMWDAEVNSALLKPRHYYATSGSDEAGLGEPLVLAWKNTVYPVAEEVEVLEYFIEHFVYDGIQNTESYGVATGLPNNPDEEMNYTRAFNYPHVQNIHFALFQIADRYGLTKFRDADGYLLMAYKTAIAFFTLPMYKNNAWACGNMGEALYFDILKELRKRGYNAEADELEKFIGKKADFFLAEANPYLSEYPFDTTGYAEAYYLKKFAGGLDGAAKVVSMLRATRGRQPIWPQYGGDVRWGWGASKYQWPDELCFNYMTNQNGRALLDFFDETGDIEDLRIGYASRLGYWALVRPDGVAYNLYTWEPTRMTYDPWTSEVGCGLYFDYVMNACYAVDDPDMGLIGYGCDVEGDVKGHIGVVPRDGAGRRVKVCPFGVSIESNATRMDRVDVEDDGKKVVLLISEILNQDTEETITISGLPKGNYTLSVNYTEQGTVTSEQCAEGVKLPIRAGANVPVHFVQD